MKKKWCLNHALQEGLFFLLLSGWLLWYSLDAYGRSYIKDWTQSPSLFPVIIAGLLAIFGVSLVCQGVREKECAEGKAGHIGPVVVLLLLSIAYYAALSIIDLPYMGVTLGSMTFVLSTFEVATVVFLAAMMLYLGVRSKLALVLVPLLSSAFLSVMFRTLLRVLLP